jgi:hypothetical protein
MLLVLSSDGLALGGTISYQELKEYYFGTIEKVSTCGYFVNEMNMGSYRLIQSHLFGGTMLFVDEVSFKQNYLQVVKGYSFPEINNDHKELDIIQAMCESNDRTVTVKGMVDGSGHSEALKYKFQIKVDMDTGEYQYTEF